MVQIRSQVFKTREGSEEDSKMKGETKAIYSTVSARPSVCTHAAPQFVRTPDEPFLKSIPSSNRHGQYKSNDLDQLQTSAPEHLNTPTSSMATSVPKLVILRTPREQAWLEHLHTNLCAAVAASEGTTSFHGAQSQSPAASRSPGMARWSQWSSAALMTLWFSISEGTQAALEKSN